MVWGILPSGARLAKFLPKTSPDCQLCKKSGLKIPESLEHALFNCAENKETPGLLIKVLKSYDPNVTPTKLLTLDINLESHMEIPLLWIIATTLSSIWTQRQEGKICAAKTRAQLEARCRLLREGRGTSLENAFTLADIAIQAMYAWIIFEILFKLLSVNTIWLCPPFNKADEFLLLENSSTAHRLDLSACRVVLKAV